MTTEQKNPDWLPIDGAPHYKPVLVRLESGWECAAELKSRSCTGMCVPRGQKIHTLHIHDEWVAVNQDGDELHPLCGREVLRPTGWRELPYE